MALQRLCSSRVPICFDICCYSPRPDIGLEVTRGRYGHLASTVNGWPMDLKRLSWTGCGGEYFESAADGANIRDEIVKFILHALTNASSVLVTHHMEWKAHVIEKHLEDAGLRFLATVWAGLAKGGICLMSCSTDGLRPAPNNQFTPLARWRHHFCKAAGGEQDLPQYGQRAKVYSVIAYSIIRATLPACARGLAMHVYEKTPVDGPRDNGECDWVCTECGARCM